MDMRLLQKLGLYGAGVVLLVGCVAGDRISIEGQFHGVSNQNIVLERLSPKGSVVVDSTRTSPDGQFDFQVQPQDKNPTFYNVRYDGSYVPLLLEPGEQVTLDAVGNVYFNYRVTGSQGSAQLRELTQLTTRQARSLDSISRHYEMAYDPQQTAELGRAYGAKYIQLKRSVIGFVIKNSTSLVSLVPLYQPLFGQKFIFDEPTDIIYFRAVADSLASRYPTSPYVQSLLADMQRFDQAETFDSLLHAGSLSQVVLPELQAKDPSGQVRKLSELYGQVVLLEFTSYAHNSLKANNQELIPTYNKYKERGFEVFQVCVDRDKAAWINSVLEARLPWIAVNDMLGESSPNFRLFNVRQVPTRLLLDRTGAIVGRDQYDQALDRAIEALL